MKMAGRGAMSFGKSKAKMMSLDKNKITFKNVLGAGLRCPNKKRTRIRDCKVDHREGGGRTHAKRTARKMVLGKYLGLFRPEGFVP
jgi:hypothetical protein